MSRFNKSETKTKAKKAESPKAAAPEADGATEGAGEIPADDTKEADENV